jgi:hypothetical protein
MDKDNDVDMVVVAKAVVVGNEAEVAEAMVIAVVVDDLKNMLLWLSRASLNKKSGSTGLRMPTMEMATTTTEMLPPSTLGKEVVVEHVATMVPPLGWSTHGMRRPRMTPGASIRLFCAGTHITTDN